MKLRVKSNGNVVTMKNTIFQQLPEDLKRSYDVISNEEEKEVEKRPVIKKELEQPDTGEKK